MDPGALLALALALELGRSAGGAPCDRRSGPSLRLVQAARSSLRDAASPSRRSELGGPERASRGWLPTFATRRRRVASATPWRRRWTTRTCGSPIRSLAAAPSMRQAGSGSVDEAPPPGREPTPIVRDGEVVALLDHRTDVLDAPGDDGRGRPRSAARPRARTAAGRDPGPAGRPHAARKRIVAAADAERQHLERDLHDGAQQRLIALSIAPPARSPASDRELDRSRSIVEAARREIGLAIDELRDVAHGIYPSILADEGLVAAIEGLAEGSTRAGLVRWTRHRPRSIPGVEAAAYAVVAGVVGRGVGPVRVAAGRSGGPARH